MMHSLAEVLQGTEGRLDPGFQGNPEQVTFSDIIIDSRQVTPGSLFVALQGSERDGHEYIPDALSKGAGGLLVRDGWPAPPLSGNIAIIYVPDTLKALQAFATW